MHASFCSDRAGKKRIADARSRYKVCTKRQPIRCCKPPQPDPSLTHNVWSITFVALLFRYMGNMSRWRLRVLTIVFVIAGWERVMTAERVVTAMEQLQSPSPPAANGGRQRSAALLLAVQDGQKGQSHLREWITYVLSNSAAMEVSPVWVVCLKKSKTFALVANLAPQFQTFVVEPDASWDAVLRTFALQVWYRREKGQSKCGFPDLPNSVSIALVYGRHGRLG